MIASAAGIRESFGQQGRLVSRPYQSLACRFGELAREGGGTAPRCGQGGRGCSPAGDHGRRIARGHVDHGDGQGTADEGGSRLNALLSALSTVTEPTLDRRGECDETRRFKNRSEVARLRTLQATRSLER